MTRSSASKLVYIRWEPPHGWSLGTITHKITSATPRLFKKFNFKVKYIDGSIGPGQRLPLDIRHTTTTLFRPDCAVQLVVPVGEG